MPPIKLGPTVSLPPREKAAARAALKAKKIGRPIPKKPSAPSQPSIATSRPRRKEYGYYETAGRFEVREVHRRRPVSHNPPVPYLPGQEDIPRSDNESDDATDLEPTNSDSEREDCDMDAEGEDDPATLQIDKNVASTFDLTTRASSARPGDQVIAPADVPQDLLADLCEEDFQILYRGFNHYGDPPLATNPQNFGAWTAGCEEPSLLDRIHTSDPPEGLDTGETSTAGLNFDGRSTVMEAIQAPVPSASTNWASSAYRPHGFASSYTNQAHTGSSPVFPPHISSPYGPSLRLGSPPRLHSPFRFDSPLQNDSLPLPTIAASFASPSHLGSPHLLPDPMSRGNTPVLDWNRSSIPVRNSSDTLGLHVSTPRSRSRTPRPSVRASSFTGRLPQRSVAPYPRHRPARNSQELAIPPTLSPRPIDDDEFHFSDSMSNADSYEDAWLDSATNNRRVPTLQEVRHRKVTYYETCRRKRRTRAVPENLAPLRTGGRRMGTFDTDENMFIVAMQHRLFFDMITMSPWRDPQNKSFKRAARHAGEITGLDSNVVMGPGFKETVVSKLAAIRGSPLKLIESIVEDHYDITTNQKNKIYNLMAYDQFLFPGKPRPQDDYFRTRAIGKVLVALFFRSTRSTGLIFMEDLCAEDDALECAEMHKKLRDRTATQGMPVGAIAFAATVIWFTFEKLKSGMSNLQFSEQNYQEHWQRYYRRLLGLPHLGSLRTDLLNVLKEYYMNKYLTDESDNEEYFNAPLAW